MVWYFQSSPHDTHDWDATQTPVLFDDVINGQPRKLLAQASRNGKFFVLDRATGRAIVSTEYIKTNWSLGTDERGQPIPNPEKRPQIAGALVTPNQARRDQLVFADVQPADRPVLRQRESRLQRLVHLRPERQPDGMGRHGPRRLRRTGAAQGHRLQDRRDPLEHSAVRRQLRPAEHGRQRHLRFGRVRASGPTTRPRERRCGTRASAASPTARSPTSSTASSTSSPRPAAASWRSYLNE